MGKGSNSAGLRRYHERVVLAFLRRMKSTCKSDLARACNLTTQAVTHIVDELENAGLVIRNGLRRGGKGPPSTLYAINPKGAHSIGIKVGRQNVELLLMDFGGYVLEQENYELNNPEPNFLLEKVAKEITILAGKISRIEQRKIVGVGVALPWFIGDRIKEFDHGEHQLTTWREINFGEELAKRINFPVFFENDYAAAAIAELQFGSGSQESNFLYVLIDTFVGGGLVLNGNLETGAHGNGTTLASMPVPASKLSSAMAHNGSFETLQDRASLFVLWRHLNANGVSVTSTLELSQVMGYAMPFVQEWLDDCADAMVYTILSTLGVLDLDAVIVDANLPRFLVDELVDIISHRFEFLTPVKVLKPRVLSGKMGVNAVVMGGAILPFYSNYAPDKTVMLKGGFPCCASF